MSSGTSFRLMVCFLLCSSEALKNITAVIGQNATLPCEVPNKPIVAVEWSRPGLEPEYVLLYRDGHFDPDNQIPSYENRVDLQDREMKDGDVSLILKDVKMEDTGTYKCLVVQGETNRWKRSVLDSDRTNIIHLEVYSSGDTEEHIGDGGDEDGGDKDGGDKDGGDKDGGDKDGRNRVGVILGVVGLILLAVAAVGFLVYKRHMKQKPNLPVHPDEAAKQVLMTV